MKSLRMKEKKMNISSCVLWWPAQEIGESKSNNPTTVFMDLQIFICELPVYSHRESRKKKKGTEASSHDPAELRGSLTKTSLYTAMVHECWKM